MENVETLQTVEQVFNKTTRSDIYNIDPRIIVSGNNIRKDYGDIPTLMNQIIEQGLLNALLVKKDPNSEKYIAIDGHRRLKAIHTAIEQGFDIKQVKCNVVPKNFTKENEIYAMLLCNTGKSLTDIEQAEGIRILNLAGYKDVEIAKRLATNPVHIGNLLKLLEAPKEILNLVENNEISISAVTSIVRHATELAKTENNEIDIEKKNNEIIRIVNETITEAKLNAELEIEKIKLAANEKLKELGKKETETIEVINNSESDSYNVMLAKKRLETIVTKKEKVINEVNIIEPVEKKATLKHIKVKEITDKFNRKTLLKFLNSLNDEFTFKGIENDKTEIVIEMIFNLRSELDIPKLAELFR
jgi:ParB/RepB/Spo0J family partition protein